MACTEHPVSADGVSRTGAQPLVSNFGHPSGTLIHAFTGTLPPQADHAEEGTQVSCDPLGIVAKCTVLIPHSNARLKYPTQTDGLVFDKFRSRTGLEADCISTRPSFKNST